MLFYMKHVVENGIKYYIINKDDKLYRGDTDARRSNRYDLIKGKKCFFALNEDTAKTYGVVLEYTVGREYKLLALDHKPTQKNIYDAASPEIQSILKNNYGYTSGIRNSVSTPDNALSDHLCKEGFEGYAIENMETDFGGTFHPEAMICDTSGLTFSRILSSDTEAKQFIHDEALRKAAPNRKSRRSRLSPSPSPENKTTRGLFGSKTPSPTKKLFSYDSPSPKKGGKKMNYSKKTRRTKRKQYIRINK